MASGDDGHRSAYRRSPAVFLEVLFCEPDLPLGAAVTRLWAGRRDFEIGLAVFC
jgi:hypothetical protein